MVFIVPSSIRVISIVKNSVTQEEAYTIEFECIAEDSKELMKELTKNPLGQRAMQLIDQAGFMPEQSNKTPEELKAEAEKEEQTIKENVERIKRSARNDRDYEWKRLIGEKLGSEAKSLIEEEMRKKDAEKERPKT